jgi:hypothetical protein|uniref:Coatomer subunit zeta n=1 Tax=Eutreptiella gymnastica TaxID=73025 RepID=A0A7S4C885_9EUGL|eukprot:CAMPEP_0174286134 /NCGR_PEP_ID=MMETSP0809-20121228/10641_1 /TAXON_ID=73025 ORGANISM="Eutreptiella gymnastica-like, Strain CCMP1594" /NCGR_SAMPLE_ID=MMETSP0809 /ASSEMBLY_ACC=CAM_ASM_000658 /LENGTH=207 /DNA_ID=CAMNT_0015382075 /DNA_START=24 /DNA_END=647 /DNA_ORIENTATION=-
MGDYLHRVEAILLLDSEGQRIFCKYYMPGYESRAKQKAFEDKLYRKVSGRVEPTARDPPSPKESESGTTDLKRILSLTRSYKKESSSAGEAGDILLFENHTVVFRYDEDGYLFVVGGSEENEVVLYQVMTCFWESLGQLLRNNCEKKVLLENFELLILIADEMIDDGIILETNPQSIFNEVSPHASGDNDTPLSALNTMAKIVKQNL